MIDTIFIFAAGLGTRMKELSTDIPKPLIKVANKPLLEHSLELALSFPFKKIVINAHYKAEIIEDFLYQFKKSRVNLPEIVTIYEPVLLETGGGIKNAVKILNLPQYIFTLNSDVVIRLSTQDNIFECILQSWDSNKMDFLLLLQNYKKAIGYKGNGDFELTQDKRLVRPECKEQYQYMYTGLSIINAKIVSNNPKQIFSLKEYYLNNPRCYGTTITNLHWAHASCPEDVRTIGRSSFLRSLNS